MVRALVAGEEEEGAKIFTAFCVECHNANKNPLEDKKLARPQWKDAVDRMISEGYLDPKPSKEKTEILLDYLVKTFGKEDASKAGGQAGEKKE